MADLPDVEVIIVPVGAGSGVCGTAIVAKTINPDVQVIGVQSAQAPTQQKSWQAGQPVEASMQTIAEGLATRISFANTQAIMQKYLDDFVLVSDRAIEEAVLLLMEHSHNMVEEAGAASLAAALSIRERLAGKKVVLVVSGGNISMERLRTLLGSDTL
jgi:threonine dehydratase